MNITDIKIINKIKEKLNKRKEQKEYLDKKQNNKSILGYYRMIDLENKEEFYIKEDVDLNEIDNLFYIPNDALIKFNFHPEFDQKDEFIFYQKLTEIFKILEKHERTYNIKINVENRELFKQSKALEHTKNLNLIINTDLNQYTKEEYIKEEKQLDSIVEPIKYSNLSPYEKYIAVYNIVKQYKEYKENPYNPRAAREIKEILNNEYMVCVGYSNLLTILLDKVNIPCISISANVEEKEYALFMPQEEKITQLTGHERNLIKIDDNKYNISGIYIADATFDNDIFVDLYNNASITYDKLKESDLLEKIRFDDYIFDAHSFNEYQEKVNYFLNSEIKSKETYSVRKRSYSERVISAYNCIYHKTMKLLYKLDKEKWIEFDKKYQHLLYKDYNTLKDIEKIYSEFLTELGYYILEISNKEIPIDTTLTAAKVVKKEINGYSNKSLSDWEKVTKMVYQDMEKLSFPYVYNPNESRRNYLENKYESRLHVKKLTHSK